MAEGAVSGKKQVRRERRRIDQEVRDVNSAPQPRRAILSDILRELKRIRVQMERQDERRF